MKVAAVVPAYNEEHRIGAVLDVLKNTAVIDEIIVVSDGSTDGTYEAANRMEGVKAIQLLRNSGKAAAMLAGARHADSDILVFLDADLVGLKPSHVEALVRPVLDESADMSIGLFKGGRRCTDWAQVIAPYISGQRALHRDDFLSVPQLENARYGVEMAIGRHARALGLRITRVTVQGVTHPMKEEKLGLLRGVPARARMYWEIARIILFSPREVRRTRRRVLGVSTEERR